MVWQKYGKYGKSALRYGILRGCRASFSVPTAGSRAVTTCFSMAFCHRYGIFRSFAIPFAIPPKALILLAFCPHGDGDYDKYGKKSLSLLSGVKIKNDNNKREVRTFAIFAIFAIQGGITTVSKRTQCHVYRFVIVVKGNDDPQHKSKKDHRLQGCLCSVCTFSLL